mmetsp:Transcript_15906/g.26249  ORF Transcript_15906/g.26249 Transcript_15906/m.26249 type:complete len:295 (+) Transcript_15906:108-992(+)
MHDLMDGVDADRLLDQYFCDFFENPHAAHSEDTFSIVTSAEDTFSNLSPTSFLAQAADAIQRTHGSCPSFNSPSPTSPSSSCSTFSPSQCSRRNSASSIVSSASNDSATLSDDISSPFWSLPVEFKREDEPSFVEKQPYVLPRFPAISHGPVMHATSLDRFQPYRSSRSGKQKRSFCGETSRNEFDSSSGSAESSSLSRLKRPQNCFILFSNEMRPKLRAQLKDVPNFQISKMLGSMWNAMSIEEKRKYEDRADSMRTEFHERNPYFVYSRTSRLKNNAPNEKQRLASHDVQHS